MKSCGREGSPARCGIARSSAEPSPLEGVRNVRDSANWSTRGTLSSLTAKRTNLHAATNKRWLR
jgi:hypothetical protein